MQGGSKPSGLLPALRCYLLTTGHRRNASYNAMIKGGASQLNLERHEGRQLRRLAFREVQKMAKLHPIFVIIGTLVA
jgi:hypothetical protein